MTDALADQLAALSKEDLRAALELFFQASNDAFCLVDLQHRTMVWSRGLELMGVRPPLGAENAVAWIELIHPEDRDRVVGAYRALALSGGMRTDQFRLARATGGYAIVRARVAVTHTADGNPGMLIASLADVTDVAQAFDELDRRANELASATRLSEQHTELVRLVRRAAFDILWEWDVETGTSILSGSVHALLGYEEDEVGTTFEWWASRIHPEDAERVRKSLEDFVARRGDGWTASYRLRAASGAYVPVVDRGYLTSGADGHLRMVGAFTVLHEAPPAVTGNSAPTQPLAPPIALTPRQQEVLNLVRQGLSNKAIAAELGIGEQAAKEHVSTLLRRFQVPNRAALTEIGVSLRLFGAAIDPAWLDALFEDSALMVSLFAGPDHVLVATNAAARGAAGRRPANGTTGRAAFPDIADPGIRQLLDDAQRSGSIIVRHEVPITWDRGLGPEPGYCTVVIQALRSAGDEVTGLLTYALDVTEQVRARDAAMSPRHHVGGQRGV